MPAASRWRASTGPRPATAFRRRAWRAGDRILSRFALALPAELPPGVYDVWVGLYESGSAGALRLPVTDAAGLAAGDGQVRVGQLTVE